ncbi:hypothetical protein [Thalassotalea sp. G2M2-11]|uniref:hypothetical protein n=1 Tax=Thalassotalea sp. G2M2-11 TaxID=2787627 RepID=UPI0019D2CB0C|nr:hypothetical protein [Thalassotalea sp. G2M2-11]
MSKEKMPENKPIEASSIEQNNSNPLSLLDQQWGEILQDWQAQPFEKTDIKALVKQTKNRTRGAKLCFVLNVIATVAILGIFIYGLYRNEFGQPLNSFLGLGGLFSLVFTYYEMKIRAKAWSQISDSPERAIENALAGYQSAVKYMALTKWSCVPFGLLANWFTYAMAQQSGKSAVPGFIFINIFIAVMFIVTEYLHRKRKKEYQALTRKLGNL